MRGTRYQTLQKMTENRIIPADAGNTLYFLYFFCSFGDHPRGCGEHMGFSSGGIVPRGSSPRMRGTQRTGMLFCRPRRIIPADAGNTNRHHTGLGPWQDHPRGCGEHCLQFSVDGAQWGSSPRMRGTRPSVSGSPCRRGIIPADAGNTPPSRSCWPAPADHPRGCGEHHNFESFQDMKQGSSPRMRGTLVIRYGLSLGLRIIPADAGNTFFLWRLGLLKRDHPRGCGEHAVCSRVLACPRGSSPRMRGTLMML